MVFGSLVKLLRGLLFFLGFDFLLRRELVQDSIVGFYLLLFFLMLSFFLILRLFLKLPGESFPEELRKWRLVESALDPYAVHL